MFGDQIPSNIVWWTIILPFGHLVWCCMVVLDKFEGHQTFDQKLKLFLLFLCLMGDVLFVWTAAYQTCLMQA